MPDTITGNIATSTNVKAEVPAQNVVLKPGLPIQNQLNDPSTAATTTFQEDLTTAGQRNINLIWETIQGKIAIYVIIGTMIIDGIALLTSLGLSRDLTGSQASVLGVINSLATGVIAFYFSRTNHTQIGGIGAKPNDVYRGR